MCQEPHVKCDFVLLGSLQIAQPCVQVPNLKSIIGVRIGQKKNIVKSFSAYVHRLVEIPICIQIDANGPAGLPNWCFNTYKNSILG